MVQVFWKKNFKTFVVFNFKQCILPRPVFENSQSSTLAKQFPSEISRITEWTVLAIWFICKVNEKLQTCLLWKLPTSPRSKDFNKIIFSKYLNILLRRKTTKLATGSILPVITSYYHFVAPKVFLLKNIIIIYGIREHSSLGHCYTTACE